MNKMIISIAILAFLVGCDNNSKDDIENKFPDNMYIDSSIDFKLEDTYGNDLLSDRTQGFYNCSDIDKIVLKEGKQEVFNDPLLTASKGFTVFKFEDHYYIRLFLEKPISGESESITYVRFGDSDIYTFKTEYTISVGNNDIDGGSSVIKNKIWFNNSLFWDSSNPEQVPVVKVKPKK